MIYLNPKWVIIILNMNGQNIIIKNHEFSNRIKKQDSSLCCLQQCTQRNGK